MSLKLNGKEIERVQIVDDDPMVRAAYKYPVEELQLEPILAEGPLPVLDQFITDTLRGADAAILDHQLRARNYANFNGAESVARLYQEGFPAVLCTTWADAKIDEMRRFRRFIPVILRPDELEPDSLVHGFERCIEEFNGRYRPSRKPWRSLIRVEDVDDDEWRGFLFVVIPGWDPNEVIRLRRNDVPGDIRERIEAGARRFHAHVNIGAETHEELFFEDWEVR